MKRTTLNFGPFGVYLWGGILLASGAVFAGGAALTVNNQGTIYTSQLANGMPMAGKYPRGGACPTGTSIDTSTGTTDRQCWSRIPVGDIDGLNTSYSTFTGGTLYAGSNVALSTGTDTTTATAADLGSSPRVHVVGVEPTLPACVPGQLVAYTGTGTSTTTAKGCVAQSTGAALSFSTSTPASVATSGSVGTSTLLVRADHVHAYTGIPVSYYTSTPVAIGTSGAVGTSSQVTRGDHTHQGDGNNKVAAYASQTPRYLTDAMVCTNGTISITGNSGVAVVNANLGSTNGTVAAGDDSRFGLVSVASGYSMGYLADRIESTTGSLTAANNLGVLNLNVARSTSTPAAVGTSGSVGTAVTSSRSDHVHAEGSGARTPTAHASTHNPGGTDVPSAFTNTPGVGKVATLVSAGQNLDGWTTATATPGTAATIMKAGAAGYGNQWLSLAASPFSSTPGADKVPYLVSGGDLNAWITGKTLVSSRSYVDGGFFVTSNSTWTNKAAHTFTATGTVFMVHLEAVFADGYNNGRLCGLGVMADAGSTASTLRGNGAFQAFTTADASGYNVLYSSKYINGYLSTDVYVTLSAGSVTFAVAMWGAAGGYTCAIPASSATMLIHEFK